MLQVAIAYCSSLPNWHYTVSTPSSRQIFEARKKVGSVVAAAAGDLAGGGLGPVAVLAGGAAALVDAGDVYVVAPIVAPVVGELAAAGQFVGGGLRSSADE